MRAGYVVFVLAVLVAAWRLQTPAPLPADAPGAEFSATRAFADITAIAQKPHPVGTAEHGWVRDYLVQRLASMGLAPQLRQDVVASDLFGNRTVVAPVTNILGVLKGKDPAKPAVLLMSHYDSVPNSPGAADNTAGVAATLEIARALAAGPQPERDVMFLITDGEELGMMGATAFFERDPLAAHVGVVINFDARGDSGQTTMYETGPQNADTVAMYAAAVSKPNASSLSRAIYKHMPNGSDFTLPLNRGLPGLNFAFIEDEASYHAPIMTPERLNLGSVQHMGDQALSAARAFVARLPEQKADAVYSDVLGLFFIQYSFAMGWVLLAITALLAGYAIWAAWRLERPSWTRGAAGVALIAVVPSVLLALGGWSFMDLSHYQRLSHFGFLMAGSTVLAVASIGFAAALVARKAQRPPALWQAMVILLLLLALVLQIFLPEAAFVVVWPLLIAAAVAALRFGLFRGERPVASFAVAAVAALIVIAQAVFNGSLLFTGVGVDMPAVVVMPMLTIVLLLLLLPDGKPLPLWTHAALLGAGIALFAYGRLTPPTAENPRPSIVRYLKDLDSGKAYRIAVFEVLDPWSKAALGTPRYSAMPWSEDVKYWWGPAKPVAVPPSTLEIQRFGDKLRLVFTTAPGAYSAVLSVRASEALGESRFDGVTIRALKANERHSIQYFTPDPKGGVWEIDAPKKGKLDVTLSTTYLDWPKEAEALPDKPANVMAFGTSGSTQTVLRKTWTP